MRSVLLTQCLQRDFVEPLRPGDPLPNKLHVGADEARRLLGDDPAHSPLAQLLGWAADDPDLELVHVRDWHDPADPRQATHLATFGPHCLRDTPGARLVVEARGHLVDATGLNDVEETTLAPLLRSFGPIRVGVIGVWTDAKVSFLLYDLATRLGVTELATCSALTASNARSRHFHALDQLERLLGVRVFHDVAGFADWLRPGARPAPPPRRSDVAIDGAPLAKDDVALVGHLFRDAASVTLDPLAGGFSGAQVFRAKARDADGTRHADTVVKLGPSALVGPERAATERIAERLGNNVPSIRGYVDFGDRAAVRYAWAAMGHGRVRTFKHLWETGTPAEELCRILDQVFDEVLQPLYDAARYESFPLLERLQFTRWAPAVREAVTAVLGRSPTEETLVFPGGYQARNLCWSYERDFPSLPTLSGEQRLVCQLHGDLNTANILVDSRDNTWVIDFARTWVGPVLMDLAKLENDLLYILTPAEDLAGALRITRVLRKVQDLRAPLPEACPAPGFERTWTVLRHLRGIAARICREERSPTPLALLLVRYAAHTLTFAESSPAQRMWALAAACGFAEDAVRALRADHVLRVDEVPVPSGRMGLTICPGRRDRGRMLDDDLDRLRDLGIRRIVCLVTTEELHALGCSGLRNGTEARGMRFVHVEIPDQGVPSIADGQRITAAIRAGLDNGEAVLVHCVGGLGRSGTLAACVLRELGTSAPEAIAAIRRARGPRAIENRLQERFVEAWVR